MLHAGALAASALPRGRPMLRMRQAVVRVLAWRAQTKLNVRIFLTPCAAVAAVACRACNATELDWLQCS